MKPNFKKCVACKLSAHRRNVVEGCGDIPAELLFIGDGPSKADDVMNGANTGLSGHFFDAMLIHAGLLFCTKYITNCVLCRPCDNRSSDNRAPEAEEILACQKNVLQIVDIVKPSKIIFLGKTVQRYYKKYFPHAITITHPSVILHEGGTQSSDYLRNIRILEGVKNG